MFSDLFFNGLFLLHEGTQDFFILRDPLPLFCLQQDRCFRKERFSAETFVGKQLSTNY